jgi:hypothetical protein
MGARERGGDFEFHVGKSDLPPLEKPKAKKPVFEFRGSGLDEFKISPQELADQGLEADDEGEKRVSEMALGKESHSLERSEADLIASGVESRKKAEERAKDVNISRGPGGLEDFRMEHPSKILEDPWKAAKRVAEMSSSAGAEELRGPVTSELIESDSQRERRLSEPKSDGEVQAEIGALRIELGRLEAEYAQMSTDIMSLQGRIEEQRDPVLQEAQRKVLRQFERERLVVNEELKQTEKELKQKEEEHRQHSSR